MFRRSSGAVLAWAPPAHPALTRPHTDTARAIVRAYTSTRPNISINKNTKVITQGFTGKQVRLHVLRP